MRERLCAQGAEIIGQRDVHFRVWAPDHDRVEVVIDEGPEAGSFALAPEGDGYFSARVPGARPGTRYRYRLGNSAELYPDPASRFQPEGPHGPSQVVDAAAFPWTDAAWRGVSGPGQVLYEMHVGTFTREGTWAAAIRQLPELSALGITLIECMPVADFAGEFGWGYDGVNLYAPTRLYGEPDAFRAFVDAAHALGMGVILDVVYNHLGPDGNYLRRFSEYYFSSSRKTDWGDAINYDGDHSVPVRRYMADNAAYWIAEFHLDGLRLDATPEIHDASDDHILGVIVRRAREAAGKRRLYIAAENECQHVRLVKPRTEGGYGIDALWNDDFHHAAMVALTGHNEAYYTDYLGTPQEFVSAAKHGYLYQGQRYQWQRQRRGTPSLGLHRASFIHYLQNHDQVANSAYGARLHQLTSPGRYRAMSALLLLAPQSPLIFQGQEFAASSPFLYFADHKGELADAVRGGRKAFLSQFASLATPEAQAALPDACARSCFVASKLDHGERETHAAACRLYRDLLRLRREDPVFRLPARIDGAVLGAEAFVLRFFGDDERLLLVNLGRDLHLAPCPEPLLAPPQSLSWQLLWSSEDPSYGGFGTPPPDGEDNWRLPGHAAVAMRPVAGGRPDSP